MPSTTSHLVHRGAAVAVALLVALGSSGLSIRLAARPAPGQQPGLQDIMRTKLEHSQSLLTAVVLGEHLSVERHALELTRLSEASTWTPLRTPEYLRYAADFRETAGQLREEAQNRNMERVAFAYTELVTTCVQCHRHVRGAQSAD